jgi:hypothetical protein
VSEPIFICHDGSLDAVRATGTAAALLGPRLVDAGVSQQIAEHAGRPVLIVPAPR